MTSKEFIALVTADQPEAPSYFSYDAQLNREEHPSLEYVIDRGLVPLTLDAFLAHQQQGAQVVDVRRPVDYAGGHVNGSLNISLVGKFATWAGVILNPKCPIVLVAEPGQEQEAIQRLGRIGFDQVVGYMESGMHALQTRPDLVTRGQRISAQALAEQLTTQTPPLVLDVRTTKEWESGHIDQSLNIPLPHLAERMQDIPTDRPVVVHCASGYRSSIAMGLLEKSGKNNAMDLVGGYEAWEKTWGHPGRKSQPEYAESRAV
jgi:hydroxyacylglutathione hydrolase